MNNDQPTPPNKTNDDQVKMTLYIYTAVYVVVVAIFALRLFLDVTGRGNTSPSGVPGSVGWATSAAVATLFLALFMQGAKKRFTHESDAFTSVMTAMKISFVLFALYVAYFDLVNPNLFS